MKKKIKKNRYLAIKVSLKAKEAKFESHKNFLYLYQWRSSVKLTGIDTWTNYQ